MNNFYNYFFYIIAVTSKKLNNSNNIYEFSSVAYISICEILNIMTLFFILQKYNSVFILNSFQSIVISCSILILNSIIFLWKNKAKKIITFYNEKYKNKKFNTWSIALIILYMIFSFVFCFYITYLNHNYLR